MELLKNRRVIIVLVAVVVVLVVANAAGWFGGDTPVDAPTEQETTTQ